MSVAVEVENLGKCYKLYRRPEYRLVEAVWPRAQLHEKLWALRHISFQLQAGESLAIIGPNGAGKSTLLRILAGATRQTEGTYRLQGRVGAVLELGLGFAPTLTGRQNIRLAALLMGLTPEVVDERIDAITAFAELGSYIDRPVREYSSGMRSRLGFSIASHLDVSVLLADEALSAGDNLFRIRASERVRQLLEQGTTLVYATHSGRRAQELCQKAMWIEYGRIMELGEVGEVVRSYSTRGKSILVRHQASSNDDDTAEVPATILAAFPTTMSGEPLDAVEPCTQVQIEILLYSSGLGEPIDVICQLTGGASKRFLRFCNYDREGLLLASGFHRLVVRMKAPRGAGSYDLVIRLARARQVFGDRFFETRVLPAAIEVIAPEEAEEYTAESGTPFRVQVADPGELARVVPSRLDFADHAVRAWLRAGWQFGRNQVRVVGSAEFFLHVPREATTIVVRCRKPRQRVEMLIESSGDVHTVARPGQGRDSCVTELVAPVPDEWKGQTLLLRLRPLGKNGPTVLQPGHEIHVLGIFAHPTPGAAVQAAAA